MLIPSWLNFLNSSNVNFYFLIPNYFKIIGYIRTLGYNELIFLIL
ncbi:hypothetical protein MADA3029_900100 [Vibrio nigripulchritudo MADA3029]|nr:hypothetical protein VIBNIMADA3020_1040063 [Vibrio nigripulchritudo MADA3020]CCN51791.1 hypothetical protein VIBNIMADA3021_1160099 [Vibrio nigripulchritudo MADA3021]CCN61955.1 hypothetical protein MADA3029_900100 [Vibrio nigripulchritudo MADA3029]